jgi:hypothetical protein
LASLILVCISRHDSTQKSSQKIGTGQFLLRRVSAARNGIGWKVGAAGLAEIETAAKAFVQVEAGSSAFEAWAAALDRGGVNLPWPDAAKYVWLPSEWPPDEREREDALRDEAAEIMGVEG